MSVYEAKVTDYGVSQTKAGKPQAMIRFAYTDESGAAKTINWFGSFAEGKASEITIEALSVCGLSTNNPADLAKGKGSRVLDENRTVTITLANEEYQGKTTLKVKYINPLGGQAFRNQVGQADAVKMFAGLNLSGVAAKMREKHKPQPLPNYAPGAKKDGDVGF